MLRHTIILLCILLLPGAAAAEAMVYAASLEDSAWNVNATPGRCELSQIIPDFGSATFMRRPGAPMVFFLTTEREDAKSERAVIESWPTEWQSNAHYRRLGRITLAAGRQPAFIRGRLAQRMFYALEQGRQPTFVFAGWAGDPRRIHVVLSAARFRAGLDDFLACTGKLPAMPFDRIKETTVHFGAGRNTLNAAARRALTRVATYLRLDHRVKHVVISGHTDSRGSLSSNEETAARRADAVRAFFLDYGLDPKLFDVRSYGERRPVDSNLTARGRANNRRVTIELSRQAPAVDSATADAAGMPAMPAKEAAAP